MSIPNAIGTAALVVGGGVAVAIGYAQLQKGRALASGTKAAQQLADAGGDPTMLDSVLNALKAAGGETSGAARTASGVASNENAGEYGIATLDSAKNAMRQAGSPAQLGRNLRVVRPKDKASQWGIGEGCWLPEEGADNGWRTEPVESVRGLNLGYALTYLPDVYPAPEGSGAVVAYDPRYGVIKREVYHGNDGKHDEWDTASPLGLQNVYQVMITSTAQGGGQVALWDRNTGGFLAPGARVIYAVQLPANSRQDTSFGPRTYAASSFLRDVARALKSKTVYQPFPPIRLVSKR